MISLTYFSTGLTPFSSDELQALLEVSRTNNRAASLTGMLLYDGRHFVQTLEGDAADVDRVFAIISSDPRHDTILVALREEITERQFPEWVMGFDTISTDRATELPGFTDYLGRIGRDTQHEFGRAGVFHRVFRDNMR